MSYGSTLYLLRTTLGASVDSIPSWLLRAGMMAINNAAFFSIWFVLFSHTGDINGWTLHDTMLLFGISAASFGLSVGIVAGQLRIPQLVREGQLHALLLRPRSPLLLVLASRSEPSGWGDVASGLVLISCSYSLSVQGWLLLLPVALLVATIITSVAIIFFSLSFWWTRCDSTSFFLWDTLISLSLYPEGIFPTAVRGVLYTALPAAWISFIPVAVLKGNTWPWLLLLVAVALIWCALARTVFYAGVRRFVRTGGGGA
jgi:ABC-2 type transport system permease protein